MNLLEVGRITKPHGVRGDVLVALVTDRAERLEPGSELVTEDGVLVVVSARPQQDRWIVRFEGVDGREAAEDLRATVLFAEPIDEPGTLWVHELIGATVRSVDGTERGVVEAVIENPAADLLQLDSGALVPVVFVIDGPTEGVVVVDTPEGLFELYEEG